MKEIINKNECKELDIGMSNFDHSIDDGLEQELKKENVYANYAGWNFHGTIFFDKEKKQFGCEVRQYHSLMEIVYKNTLKEIMEEVSDKYGYE